MHSDLHEEQLVVHDGILAAILDFGDAMAARKEVAPTPKIDKVLLAQILGVLGKSELPSSLCLLAVAAESGSLMLDEETDEQLKEACSDIHDIRLILISALGLRT